MISYRTSGIVRLAQKGFGHYEIYVDRAKKYRWRLRRPGGLIVADSGQGYVTRAACEADLRWIIEWGARAPVRSLDLEILNLQPRPDATAKP